MTFNPLHMVMDEDPPDGKDGANVLGTTGNQASASRAAFVLINVVAAPSGATTGEVNIDVDFDDGGATDATHRAFADVGAASANHLIMLYLPPGATYDVRNTSDPNGNNEAKSWEWIQ